MIILCSSSLSEPILLLLKSIGLESTENFPLSFYVKYWNVILFSIAYQNIPLNMIRYKLRLGLTFLSGLLMKRKVFTSKFIGGPYLRS